VPQSKIRTQTNQTPRPKLKTQQSANHPQHPNSHDPSARSYKGRPQDN